MGLGLGLLVAAQVGPVSLLVIRTVLRRGLAIGIAMACGVALIDATYAMVGVAGAGALLRIDALRLTLGLAGAVVLVVIGVKTLWSAFRLRDGGETDEEVGSAWRAFLTAVVATASNPLTIASWGAVFAAASTAAVATSPTTTAALLIGIGTGTFCWFTALSTATSLARRRVGARMLALIDMVAGLGIVGFGAVLGVRAVTEES